MPVARGVVKIRSSGLLHVKPIFSCRVVVIACCYCSPPFSFLFKKSEFIVTQWSMIPACPSLMCFFFFFLNRDGTKGTNSLIFFVFDVCVCFVLCEFVYGTDFVVFE